MIFVKGTYGIQRLNTPIKLYSEGYFVTKYFGHLIPEGKKTYLNGNDSIYSLEDVAINAAEFSKLIKNHVNIDTDYKALCVTSHLDSIAYGEMIDFSKRKAEEVLKVWGVEEFLVKHNRYYFIDSDGVEKHLCQINNTELGLFSGLELIAIVKLQVM